MKTFPVFSLTNLVPWNWENEGGICHKIQLSSRNSVLLDPYWEYPGAYALSNELNVCRPEHDYQYMGRLDSQRLNRPGWKDGLIFLVCRYAETTTKEPLNAGNIDLGGKIIFLTSRGCHNIKNQLY